MMALVLAHNFHGYVGIEHGEEGREWDSINDMKIKLEEVRKTLEA